jgi:hypothetical protein
MRGPTRIFIERIYRVFIKLPSSYGLRVHLDGIQNLNSTVKGLRLEILIGGFVHNQFPSGTKYLLALSRFSHKDIFFKCFRVTDYIHIMIF